MDEEIEQQEPDHDAEVQEAPPVAPESGSDTNVSTINETRTTDQLVSDTLALIENGGKSPTKSCARLKTEANERIEKFREAYFDTWLAIAKNLSELRSRAKTGGASFGDICLRLGLQRTKCTRLADCHERLVKLPVEYQQALRELRKYASDEVIKKVEEVEAESNSETPIKDQLAARFGRTGKPKSPAKESVKTKFLSVLASGSLQARRDYLKEVMEEATQKVGMTLLFDEESGVVSVHVQTFPTEISKPEPVASDQGMDSTPAAA